MSEPTYHPVLYVVVCGAGPAGDVTTLLRAARTEGWDTYVTATPAGLPFLDVPAIEALTGHPVRSAHRAPGTPREPRPPAHAVIVAPATSNTINKLACGISDTYALDMLSECIGASVPVIVLPFVNTAYAARAPFQTAVAALRDEGVHVLLGKGGFEPHPAGSGGHWTAEFPWLTALTYASRVRSREIHM